MQVNPNADCEIRESDLLRENYTNGAESLGEGELIKSGRKED